MKIFAIVVFVLVMGAIMTEKLHRATAALAGAVLLVICGVMTGKQAIGYIDFNTIGVLVGMMIVVAVIRTTGMFEYISIKAAKAAKGDPWKILIAFVLITAILSAFLDNVTTVLLVGPMSIAIARMLEINPVPFLMMQILASNVGGTATMIGDPPNIMIGSASGLSFMDFIANTGAAAVLIIIAQIIVMKFLYKEQLESGPINKTSVMNLDPDKSITNRKLMKQSIAVMVLVVIGFVIHDKLGFDSCMIALGAAAIMLIIGHQEVDQIISEVEWTTIVFFMSLFVVVGGLERTGVIHSISSWLISATEGHYILTMLVLLWASALLSSVLDNIPFVATLIPLVLTMQQQGMNVEAFWWAISLGACLGGNGTMIGASANVVLSDIANKHGYPITFKSYLRVGFPFMLMSVVIATVFLLVRYAL
ncbi:MAG: ArsB/NhaD family transporter [Baileyella intestinalis]|uniref:SLC13 family permease n=1 Tax=Baileyella intestinalis TaxID=2606709 RepID=UPI002A75242A|nr:ArsB/NhaD family transporter [Baileyella intestinalis]MCI7686112.1 ArsB/NhaD family transporter [Clostridiales bacterium]MDY2994503.1 ArsB/NhaD family transporter [Baileyella intestinalis]